MFASSIIADFGVGHEPRGSEQVVGALSQEVSGMTIEMPVNEG
jgi:hypothetical protein